MYYAYYNSPLGMLELCADDQALLSVELASSKHFRTSANSTLLDQTIAELDEYFAGKRKVFEVPLGYEETYGTPFMREVWEALRAIPYGQTRTYREIAEAIGRPRACRAVGNANNKNPHMIIVPCHRVVGTSNPWGYASGPEHKRFLLDLEGAHV